jgi:hypothetical protein
VFVNEHERALLRTGNVRVLELLDDRQWHTAAEIEERCEVTAHSRLSDLRGAGCVIDKQRNPGATGRRMFSYRLIATGEETSALDESEVRFAAAASGSSSVGDSGRSDAVDGAAATVAGAAAPDGDELDHVRSPEPHADARQTGNDSGRDILSPFRPEPAFDELDDAGWRDLFPAESAGEALPAPSGEQLPLLDEAVS